MINQSSLSPQKIKDFKKNFLKLKADFLQPIPYQEKQKHEISIKTLDEFNLT